LPYAFILIWRIAGEVTGRPAKSRLGLVTLGRSGTFMRRQLKNIYGRGFHPAVNLVLKTSGTWKGMRVGTSLCRHP